MENNINPTEIKKTDVVTPTAVPTAFQNNMNRLRSKVQDYFLKAKQPAKMKLEAVTTPDQYNSNFSLLDNNLANTVSAIVVDCLGRRAYHFGNKPNFDFADGSILRKAACNCAHNPVTVAAKKGERLKAEAFLRAWEKGWDAWVGKGHLVLVESDIYHVEKNKAIPKKQAVVVATPKAVEPKKAKRNYVKRIE